MPSPTPTVEELAAEIVRLESQYPPPDEEEIKADCRWLQDHWGTEVLARYSGTHVAVYNGRIVGHADNSLQLELDLTKKFGVHPQRFVIEYIPRPLES